MNAQKGYGHHIILQKENLIENRLNYQILVLFSVALTTIIKLPQLFLPAG